MPDTTAKSDFETGRLFYDHTCAFCRRWMQRLRPFLHRTGVKPVPFVDGAAESEMSLHWNDGRRFGGADAAIFLADQVWWTRPFAWLARLPVLHRLAHRGYRRVAAKRHCLNGACALPRPDQKPIASAAIPLKRAWMTTGLLVAAAIALATEYFPGNSMTDGWVTMWLVAVALWSGFKFIAWSRCVPRPDFVYLFWPGMDAADFIERKPAPLKNGLRIAGMAGLFLLLGLTLIGFGIPEASNRSHLVLAGWLGMIGLVFTLHFGIFALMALGWNRIGYPVQPLMNAPWRANSLGNFWGDRWNRAFSLVARIAVFRPLVRRLGLRTGTLAGFLLSGIAHELVISLPARAGWGLPTVYFLIQGIGVLGERRLLPEDASLATRRVFTFGVILLPAPLLFHPPFLETVIGPGFNALAGFLFP